MIWFLAISAVPALITALKGRWGLVAVGSLSLGRLAKPDSPWARRYYDSDKRALARARFARRRAPAGAGERSGLDRLFNIERNQRPAVPSTNVAPEITRELSIRSASNQRVLGWLLVISSPIVFFFALLGTTNLDPESQVIFTLLIVPGALLVGGLVLAVRGQRSLRRLA